MALFGDLEHHTLTDLARVLKSQTGTLFFHEAYQGRTLELTLVQGEVHALYLDGFPVQEPARVRDILRELHGQGRGAFEFQRRTFPATAPGFSAPALVDLLREFSEAFIPVDQLPHPETRFLAAEAPSVPASLAAEWALLQPHLVAGASASELCTRVGRPQRDVQVMLHRLRAVDLIAPYRSRAAHPQLAHSAEVFQGPAALAAAPLGQSPVAAPPASAPLMRRLLGALRRLAGAART